MPGIKAYGGTRTWRENVRRQLEAAGYSVANTLDEASVVLFDIGGDPDRLKGITKNQRRKAVVVLQPRFLKLVGGLPKKWNVARAVVKPHNKAELLQLAIQLAFPTR
jgi:hypothetical protein